MKTARDVIAHSLRLYATLPYSAADTVLADLLSAGYAIVPIKPTERMLAELVHIGDGPLTSEADVWGYMLAAATAAPPSEDKQHEALRAAAEVLAVIAKGLSDPNGGSKHQYAVMASTSVAALRGAGIQIEKT